MPYITKEQRAQGGHRPADVALDPDRDWSIPTDAATLRARPLTVPDQGRYGHATDAPTLGGAP